MFRKTPFPCTIVQYLLKLCLNNFCNTLEQLKELRVTLSNRAIIIFVEIASILSKGKIDNYDWNRSSWLLAAPLFTTAWTQRHVLHTQQVLPREESNFPHRWHTFSAARGREIIVWLAVADLFASLGVFIRSALWMNFKSIMPTEDDTSSVVFCAISSAWTQYFYTATWIWTLCYAIDMRLLLIERPGHPRYYHAVAWMCPAILTTFGLSILYTPDAKCSSCHNSTSLSSAVLRILPNYCATYIPLAVVMITNPTLYMAATRDLTAAVSCSMSQVTGRERKLVQTVRFKFALTNLVYYICWMPNLINGVLLWTLWFKLPIKVIISLWYIMAVTNPLQAFFNALVYQKWGRSEKFRLSWRRTLSDRVHDWRGVNTLLPETTPLLNQRFTPHTSINGSSSL
ncbi:G-protein coupled receptor 143 isoform X1 [Neodiprion lecontei]|uniref:G-protein coupled receptor 143 isoform X1 n=1 Tax=Neodiprion lecontei TaxID=441921 RepID=A0ABM3G6K4_NEOLC|nr:G-protein coupled receptor 143 isoform X1 [Neodiprion lecontei]